MLPASVSTGTPASSTQDDFTLKGYLKSHLIKHKPNQKNIVIGMLHEESACSTQEVVTEVAGDGQEQVQGFACEQGAESEGA